MGCAQSKVDNEEAVARCKERKILMKDAVAARNAFAAGHSGFALALKDTGAALSDYAHGEAHHPPPLPPSSDDHLRPPPPLPPQMIIENLPPPPPPLPNFSPSPIKRALSMPEMKATRNAKGKGKGKGEGRESDSVPIAEEEEGEEEVEEELDHGARRRRRDDGKKSSGNAGIASGPPPDGTPASPPRTPATPPLPTPGGGGGGGVVPPMPEAKTMAWDYFFMVDNMPGPSLDPEQPDDEEDHRNDQNGGHFRVEAEPRTPERVVKEAPKAATVVEEEEPVVVEVKGNGKKQQIEHSKTAPAEFMVGGGSLNLMQVMAEIDDHFLKASESAKEVSNLLEATRLHYHSNFADNRGHIDHSARVMRVITWNRSFKGVGGGEGGKDELDFEDFETHATILDKLLAWEKKLYDEVKQGEHMKLEYKRKVALLNKQKKRGASAETLEKTKAAVSHLHTRYIVDMQSLDSTVSELSHIRDQQLYPRLVALVDGMAKMWASMSEHHDSQLKIVTDLKSLDVAPDVKETTRQHHERTKQLHKVVQDWHSQFEKMVTYQKQYIRMLSSWLKLNLIPIESSLKEKVTSPPRAPNPPIQQFLHSWNDHLEKLTDELAKSAITSFAAVIKAITDHQEEEMKLKEKCEETKKEYQRKNQAFEDWYQKYMQRRTPADEAEGERGEEANPKDPVTERQFAVESLKRRLEEEIEAHQRYCLQVREKSLGNLKIRLPELFRALSDYSHACSDAYGKLRSIAHSQHPNHAHAHP